MGGSAEAVAELSPRRPRRFDVVCLGELMIDLVPEPSTGETLRFAAKPGGAPGNVAVGAARLGLRAAMLSRVGREAFGRSLLAVLRRDGVDVTGVVEAEHRSTGLAVVTLAADGDRDFFFYRDACADVEYSPAEVSEAVVAGSEVLCIGSLFLARETSAAAQRHALGLARRHLSRVAADPNFRPPLWRDREAMLRAGREVVAAASIVKVSADELEAMAGPGDPGDAAARLWHPDLQVLAVTHGPAGADLFTREHRVTVPGFAVDTVDTVGCGDAFLAALLAGLAGRGFGRLDRDALGGIGRRACAAGALAATIAGGMASLPTGGQVDAFLAARG